MYVVRPVLPTGCKSKADTCARVGVDQPVNLGGFGVELALKNMEYKAIDDSEVKKGDIGDETLSEDLGEEVRGFIFSKLLVCGHWHISLQFFWSIRSLIDCRELG